jgi:hypothetical protein
MKRDMNIVPITITDAYAPPISDKNPMNEYTYLE